MLVEGIRMTDTVPSSKNTDFFVLPQILAQNHEFLDVTLIKNRGKRTFLRVFCI